MGGHVDRPGSDRSPNGVKPLLAWCVGIGRNCEELGLNRFASLGQQSLSNVSIVNVCTSQKRNQLIIRILSQIIIRPPGSVLIANSVEAPFQAINSRWVTVGVLIAMIPIVPVEDVKRAIGAGLLHDGH